MRRLATLLCLSACARRPLKLGPPQPETPIYFAMIDRFADGDVSNNQGVDKNSPIAFHGGDLRGILEHIDDLAALGVGTVWISPFFATRDQPLDGHGAFHGYWTTDLWKMSPHFGDEQDLRKLSDELHRRGMRLVLDMVWNHAGYDAPLVSQRPDWFHPKGDVVNWDDPIERITHEVHGLPDLAQENPEVYDYLRNATLYWIDLARPDGLRIDAVRHMPLTFQARMAEDLRASAGKDLWLLGEAFEGDPTKLAEIMHNASYSAVFDFPLHYAMTDVFCKDASVGRIASVLSQDAAYGQQLQRDPGALVTFLDNHDVPRVLTACGGEADRVAQALAFLFTVRGTPSLTWGTELGLTGGPEPDNRGDQRFGETHPLGEAIGALATLRRAHPALAKGASAGVSLGANDYTWMRVTPGEGALLVLNRGDKPVAVSPPPELIAAGKPTSALVVGESGLPEPLPGPLTLDRLPDVPARSLAVVFFTPLRPDGYAPAVQALWSPPAVRKVTLHARVPATAAGETWLWVGAGKALGAWDPKAGIPLDRTGTATVSVPVGSVLASKLVLRKADGSFVWEPGEDRTVFVPAGDSALVVEAVGR